MAPEKAFDKFAVNMKTKGKVHRLTTETVHLPRKRQRVCCGWRIGASTAIVYNCSRLAWGDYCKKCFPGVIEAKGNGESIEQYEEGEPPTMT